MDTRKTDGSGLEIRINISLLSTANTVSISLKFNPAIQFIIVNIFIKISIISKKIF